ncbi:MAG TPA: transglycosylase SLT domain-containing protein [Candidatus Sulfopaludibacter sp.]|jgi:membrane-bound lytic murein transglycosylase D|nr:transglycosylase SLT domain-containing protein [Candidatus Sulfopaludibacter sp.]
MNHRTKALFSCVVVTGALTTAACGINQQSKFQMSFLPPAAHSAATPGDTEPPIVHIQPNVYLKDAPSFLKVPEMAPGKARADASYQRAQRRFEAGKRYYQAKDIVEARREFDAAVDSLLDASDQNPDEREVYERRLDEMVDAISHFDVTGMGASAVVEEGKFEKAPLEDILTMTFPVDPRLKDRVRELVASTVSQLPLAVNDTVLGYINYFATRGHKTIVAATERSGRYRAMIQRVLSEEGVPQELIHLAQAESGFIPRAVSSAAAGGMWQFLKWRGNEYGLTQTKYTDDRMDPEKATRAAARHLHDLYNEFGDWYLALAAYNCGPGTVEKAVERTGYADFWELRSRGVLPAETTNYVPIILAMTIMEKNAAEYGLDHLTFDAPVEYDSVELTAPTSLALVSDIIDTPQAELATLNPAVLKATAPENYSLHVPKGSANQLLASLQMVPAERRIAWRMHKVETGETLAAIGKKFGITPASIVTANSLKTAEAVEGDRLLIPAVLRAEVPAKRTVSSAATRRVSTSRRSASTAGSKSKPAVRKTAVLVAHNSSK